jgi:hypothetical protein
MPCSKSWVIIMEGEQNEIVIKNDDGSISSAKTDNLFHLNRLMSLVNLILKK